MRALHALDIRAPEIEAVVHGAVAASLRKLEVVLGALLVGHDARGGVEADHIPAGGHADRLRELRAQPVVNRAVQDVVAPVVGGHAQPLDSRRAHDELRHLLLRLRSARGGPVTHCGGSGGMRTSIDGRRTSVVIACTSADTRSARGSDWSNHGRCCPGAAAAAAVKAAAASGSTSIIIVRSEDVLAGRAERFLFRLLDLFL